MKYHFQFNIGNARAHISINSYLPNDLILQNFKFFGVDLTHTYQNSKTTKPCYNNSYIK